MIRTCRRKKEAMIFGINITPFTDVCLVLLIIFMVTATALTTERSLNISLPRTSSSTPLPMSLTLYIDANRQWYLNEERIQPTALEDHLRRHHAAGVELLVVKADETVPYGMFHQAVDIATAIGMTRISIVGRAPASRQ